MILQALVRHYEDLLARGVISRPGLGQAKVSYGLELAGDGRLLGLLPLQTEQARGKKTVLAPQVMEVPMPVKRTSGAVARFLCDSSGFLLGADGKGKPQYTAARFAACKTLHLKILAGAQSPAAQAVAAFFAGWRPEAAASHPALMEKWEELMSGVNLIFWYRDAPVFLDPEVRSLWQAHYDRREDGRQIRCLVTGERAAPEEIHPDVKGVQGAQPSGAALVSFNCPSFWSYGHEYAPVGAYAAFAYTTALNHLLADWQHVRHVGDTTLVCWAEGGESAYQDLGMAALYGGASPEQDLHAALARLTDSQPTEWNGARLEPGNHFYVLGLSPNAGRLSVRFFWQDRFGSFAYNIQKHYDRLRIVRPSFDKYEDLWIPNLLQETVNRNVRDSAPAPQLSGDLVLAVLTNAPYPATLLHGVTLRIRAQREITRGRAAILKAYYSKNKHNQCPEEILTMELKEQSSYPPYVLGRLFSVLEAVQDEANPGINATIKDKYFNAASATPSVIFPLLVNLAQKHLRKLESGRKAYYGRQIGTLLEKLYETYPARLTLPEQGAFQIGYYHQTQKRFTKKEEK